ncbi:MAG: DEAD/DEAH box helicase [Deltaproteobacteria bacterium]|nr:DEAD/DEAH box helicase [Deltaproteobacteria bacterium]
MAIELTFEHGTLVTAQLPQDESVRQLFVADPRTGVFRAPAQCYREIIVALKRSAEDFVDRARAFDRLALKLAIDVAPRPYQREALTRWAEAQGRGIAVLPTGAGKTLLAIMAMEHAKRPALVVVPTIDLLHQWRATLERHFGIEIGVIGGGDNTLRPVTVTTYDSAALRAEFLGNRFGLLVCDECHHLPAPAYRFIAAGSIAPYRLGLTATLERQDGGEAIAVELLGPVCHTAPIDALEGEYLAPYEVRTLRVSLSPEEQAKHDAARAKYQAFKSKLGISPSDPNGWTTFIMKAHQSAEGREAFAAWREQRRIALGNDAKITALFGVLKEHNQDRIIVFTHENELVYRLSRSFMLPAITHHTKPSERKRLLEDFATGALPVLLTAKVLNEGVDVPEANVGIVLAGSGSVREHVQRLGRILRKRPDKRAYLYEIVSEDSAESMISDRRRQHRAYSRAD